MAATLTGIAVEIDRSEYVETRSPVPYPYLAGVAVEIQSTDYPETGGNTSEALRRGNRLAQHGIRL